MRNRHLHRIPITFMSLLALAALAAAGPADFEVTSGNQKFRLSEARGRFVAIHFLMKTECPYCQKYVSEITRRASEVAGVTHVFLKPDAPEEIERWSAQLASAGITATIYRDPDAKLAKEFEIPDGYAFHGETVHYPALVLIGPDGREVFRYVGKSNTDRMPFDQLAAKVAEFSRNPAGAQYNLAKDGLALAGHDPVAYFDANGAVAGKTQLASTYRGVTYRFAGDDNRRKFAADPEKYLPAYGGWCATAMAEGDKVEIDPANFQITNGRLFLFYKGWLGDAKKAWNKDEPGLTRQADDHWHRLAPADQPAMAE